MSDRIVPFPNRNQPLDTTGVVRDEHGSPGFAGLEPSLVAMLRASTDRTPTAEALVEYGGARLTYEQVWTAATRVAGGLHRRGVRDGDRVAVRLPNGMDWCLAFFGALLAGAVPVSINTRFTDQEAAHVVSDSGAILTLLPDDALPDSEPYLADSVHRADPQDAAALFYTSGTTGVPKGAILTHRSILSALESAQRALGLPLDGVRTLVPLPLFHVMGALNQLLPTLRRSGTAVILPSFDAATYLKVIEEEQIQVVSAVPAVYWQLLHGPGIDPAQTAGVRWVIFGGAATPPAQVRQLQNAFPNATLHSGYGLTETSGGMTGLPPETALERPDSVGVALPGVDLALRGPHATEGRGELLIRSAQVMAGYWGRPDDTAEAIVDGWLCTGDAATIDAEGYIRIVDRIKDTINRGGENVYSLEVERVLIAHPGVSEAAVLAVPDPMMGEKVGAVIVRAPGADLDGPTIATFSARRLADFKVPQYVVVTDEPLPRNAMGKVDKRALRQRTDWGPPLR